MAIPKLRHEQNTYIQQPVRKNEQPQRHTPVQPEPKRRNRWTKGEKYLVTLMIAIVAVLATFNLNTHSSLTDTSKQIQDANVKITEIQKENKELTNEVSSLSNNKRILEKAKELGLTLNEKNVKVVSGQ